MTAVGASLSMIGEVKEVQKSEQIKMNRKVQVLSCEPQMKRG